MFLSLQFPLCDSRAFTSIETGVLKRPTWPSPTPNAEFVRSFGGIKLRRRGGLKGWLGENEVCDARGAVRFLDFPNSDFRCVFRRFYFDGLALGKFEIGLVTKQRLSIHDPVETVHFLTYLWGLDIKIRKTPGENIYCKLIELREHLPELYRYCSSSRKANVPVQQWWVTSGLPLLVLEHDQSEYLEIGRSYHARFVEIPADYGLELIHFRGPMHGEIPIWVLSRGALDNRVAGAREAWLKHRNALLSKARALRLYLMRLHAEHQCLKSVLRNMITARIAVINGTQATDRLQLYLNAATKRIFNWENRTEALIEADVAKLARDSEDCISPGQRDALLSLLDREKLRFHIQRRVRDYANIVVRDGGIFNMADKIDAGDEYNVRGQVGAVGPSANVHDITFNQIWTQGGKNIDLPALADELSTLRGELRKESTAPEHDIAIGAIASAEAAAKQGDGPKALEYLASGGKWVLDVATKIGVSIASEAIKKASGL